MVTVAGKAGGVLGPALTERAASFGFEFVRLVLDNGQVAWEWRRGDEPRPQFVSERVARQWMFHRLEQLGELRRSEIC